MALFKVSRGNSNNLPTLTDSGDGYCWFTYDDGKFYIDYQETESGPLKRKALNAVDADTVLQNTTSSTNTNYRILLSGTATNSTERSSLNKAATLQYNPSTDLLSTGNIELTGDLEVAGNVDLSGETTVDSLTTGNLQVNGAANFVNSPTAPTPAAASNNTTVATTAFVVSAINTLDGTLSGSPGASKTLTAFSQENGKISATFGDINITKSQVSDFSHSHGNITNAGELSTASRAVITDGNKKVTVSSATSTELGYLSGVTSAIQTQLNAKAPLASPALTGTPTAPTAAAGTNTTQIATTAFVHNAVSGLSGAMHFRGTTTSEIVDGSTTNPITINENSYTAEAGDVVLREITTGNIFEYVWTGSAWEMLGRDTSFKVQQTAVTDPTASGSATAFIDTISQDANGAITVTKKNLPSTTLATDSGTSNITLTHGGKYKLTAAGSSIIFTMPSDNNTTYTFANGTNGFTVTPSGGSAQTVTVTPSIANNITGSGTSGYLTKFNGTNTITNGPQLSSAISSQSQTTKFLREDGTWAIPSYTVDTNTDTKVVQTAMTDSENVAYNILTTTAASPATGAREAKYGVNITYNPSTNKLSTGNLKLTGELDVTGDAYLHNQTSIDSLTAGSLLVNGGVTFVQSPIAPTPAAASNDTTVATTAFVKSATVAAATALTSNAGSGTQPIYFSNGAPIATTYSLSSSVASGTGSRLAYYSDEHTISSGTATTDGQYLGNVSYLSINTAHQTGYKLYVNGTSYFNGSITSATTTDSSYSTAASAFKTSGGASIAKNLSAKSIRIDNGQSVKGVSLQYDATLEVLNFIFS